MSAAPSSRVAFPDGEAMYGLIEELYPVCRSITGDGVRETLRRIGERIPLERHEVPSGTQVFDWIVPKEWNIRDAFVKNADGERVIDFRRSSLHVLSYSVPVRLRMSLQELREHLYTLPGQPDWIPYRTSYYQERWGFCLSQRALELLPQGEYEVVIDSSLEDGHLSYGECFLPGESADEVLISCHVCHPSLCNDNLSGIALCTRLAGLLSARARRYSYRFLFVPGTIGAITWLALNEPAAARIRHGLVVANVGDDGAFHYKKSRRGNADVDRAAMLVLQRSGQAHGIEEFSPYGYDERQYCSPGFDLAVGSLTRTPWGRYPQYHTSADDLTLVSAPELQASFEMYAAVVDALECNRRYLNLNPKCEPQLGRRGLYRTHGGNVASKDEELALLWVLNLADGQHDLLDIAARSGLALATLHDAAQRLRATGLLVEQSAATEPPA